MKRRKYFNPPPGGNYGGWMVATVKPRADDPDPATMIDVMPGPPPMEVTVKPRADDPDPAAMIDVFIDGSKHPNFEVSPNGSGKSLSPPVEPTSVGSDS